jgi:hypothetical protein
MAVPLSFAMRCRLVADEVQRQLAASNERAARGWLDEQLAVLTAVRGTVAHAAVTTMVVTAGASPTMAELREWVFASLVPMSDGAWADGSSAGPVWTMLMAPLPLDQDELERLALSTHLGAAELRSVLGRDAPAN